LHKDQLSLRPLEKVAPKGDGYFNSYFSDYVSIFIII